MSGLFNARQWATLLSTGLRLSLTGSRSAGGEGEGLTADKAAAEGGSRHLLGAAYSLTMTTIVAGLLLPTATPGQYLLVTTTLSMIFTATAVVGELAGGLFHPLDLAVTAHLPISGMTRFAARFTELLVTLFVLTLNLNLVPAILFGFVAHGAGASIAASLAAPFAALAAAFCAALFTAGVCLVIYALLARFLTAAQFEAALLYLNIFISLGILGLLINIGRVIEIGALLGTSGGDWPLLFPPAWFAGTVVWALGLPGSAAATAGAAALGLLVALLPLFLANAGSEAILRTLTSGRSGGRGRSAPGPVAALFERLFVRPDELAAFEFTAVHLARDRGFRMKAYPILGVPVLMTTLSLFGDGEPLFFVLMLHLMNLYLPLVLNFLPYSDHYQAAWIFDALPLCDRRVFLRGAEKAFIFRVGLPLLLLNALVLALIWDPVEGPLHALFAWLAGLFLVGARFRFLKAFPFTREFRGVVTQDFTGALFGAFAVLGVVAWIEYVHGKNLVLFLGEIGVMILLHKMRFAAAARSRGAEAGEEVRS